MDSTKRGRFAAIVQQPRVDPQAELDLESAIDNGPRPDAGAALGLDEPTLQRLLAAVDTSLAQAGIHARIHRARLQAIAQDGPLDAGDSVELFSVLRRCAAADESTWRQILNRHFADLLVAQQERDALASKSFESIAEIVRRSLWARPGTCCTCC
jgi:hypothetical protein